MTTRPRLYKTEGIVLKSIPVGEADRMVTLYTRDMGKLWAAARGVRRSKSKLGGHLDALNRVSLSLSRGRTRDVITGADALETFRPIKSDLERLAYGLYVAELVDAITPEESPGYPIYALVVDTLHSLATTENAHILLHAFELRLLDYSGFLPELHQCVRCRREPAPHTHRFAPEAGGLLCSDCFTTSGPVMSISVNALKVLRFLERQDIVAAQRLRVPEDLDRELTTLLAASLRHVLERDVRSAAFIHHLRQLRQGAPSAFTSGVAPG